VSLSLVVCVSLSQCLSLSQCVSESAGSTRTTGDATFEDISIVTTVDKASPKLALACVEGKNFDKVDIHLTRGDSPTTYYAYELTNVQVVSFEVNGVEPSPDVPTENLSLNYEEIKVLYTEFDPSSGEPTKISGYECNLDKKGNECNEVDIPIVPTPASFDTNTALEIPEWFNTNLEWYKSGLISELEMYDNIFYLLDKEIIHT